MMTGGTVQHGKNLQGNGTNLYITFYFDMYINLQLNPINCLKETLHL
jgi:hypothetical protein